MAHGDGVVDGHNRRSGAMRRSLQGLGAVGWQQARAAYPERLLAAVPLLYNLRINACVFGVVLFQLADDFLQQRPIVLNMLCHRLFRPLAVPITDGL